MEDRARGPRSVPSRGSPQDRLQSWKEIAAYLGRDVRSVIRWEKNEGLPVHRLQHGKLGSVYAFKGELDDWTRGRSRGQEPKTHPMGPARRRVIWAAAAAGMVVLALVAWLVIAGRTPGPEPQSVLPFTSSPGIELHPALSHDGRQVAFAWNGDNGGDFAIYVKLVAGGPALQLTHDPADEYSPAWSPDGDSIAFLRRKDAERVTVVIVPALGGSEVRLLEFASGAGLDWWRPGPFLAWSRDGKWLIANARAAENANDRLVRISVATGDTQPITSPRRGLYGDSGAALSPDGATLAFSRRVSWGTSDLCLLRVAPDLSAVGEVRRLETGSTWNASPAWSQDGKVLFFSTGSMDSPHLAKIAASGRGAAVLLPGVGSYGWQPSLARTREGASRLVYVHHFEPVNIWRMPLDPAGPPSQVIASAHRSYEPDYSPDASRIAFLSDRSGYVEIWVADGDGANPRQWTFLKQQSLGGPKWSPDGRRIGFTMPGPRGSSIFWIDAAGATPKPVPDTTPSGYFSWEPDGRWVYVNSNHAGANIWKVPLQGGAATPVRTRSSSRVPSVSLDGRSLFFMTLVSSDGRQDLFRAPLAGGNEEKVLESVDAYSVCRGGIAYKYYRPGSHPDGPRLQFYSFATGKTATLPSTSKPLRYGVAASQDCRYLIYSQGDYDVSDLMLVDHLR